jgi:hypothetical protein
MAGAAVAALLLVLGHGGSFTLRQSGRQEFLSGLPQAFGVRQLAECSTDLGLEARRANGVIGIRAGVTVDANN